MRVLVTGGRDYSDRDALFAVLDELHAKTPIAVIIHGGASGADSLATAWATERGIEVVRCPADWKAHGKAAGPIRNKQMLDEHKPDRIIAFPGGLGTKDCVGRARRAGIKVVEIG